MIVLISGKFGSGKDGVAEHLQKHHGFEHFKFADKLYTIAYDLFDMKGKNRELLQQLGDGMRKIDPLVWVKYLAKQLIGTSNIVISDLRYKNEKEYFKNLGADFIRLECPEEIRVQRYEKLYKEKPTREQLDFVSEVELDNEIDWDLVLDTGVLSKEKTCIRVTEAVVTLFGRVGL